MRDHIDDIPMSRASFAALTDAHDHLRRMSAPEGYGGQISMTFIADTAQVPTHRFFSGFEDFKWLV